MSHQEEIMKTELQLQDAKLEAAIQSNGPFAKHARQKVERLKRHLAKLRSSDNARTTIRIDDDSPELIGLNN